MKKGDKVVCVNDSIKAEARSYHSAYFKNWIKKDQIYTIRKAIVEGIRLEEVINPIVYIPDLQGKTEPFFSKQRFVPLDEFLEGMELEGMFELERENINFN